MINLNKNKYKFSPLLFLAALGAGGIAIIPFAFFQYTYYAGKGLVTYNAIIHGSLTLGQNILFRGMEGIMLLFAVIHLILLTRMTIKLIRWMRTKEYQEVLHDPLKSSSLLAPFIAYAMLLNVFIGPVRFFVPFFQQNFQAMMLPALIVWGILFLALMRTEIKLLHESFVKGFDIEQIHFGWLLHPFALAMVTVTGTGIAAMSANATIAHIAAFLSMISGSMGFFLLMVKLVVIFKKHFASKGLPEKQFLPSFLIVVPNITLYAISAFRLGHYLGVQHGMHVEAFSLIVIVLSFAFEIWYLLFGLSLMKDYFKKDYFKKEYYPSLWGLVCPFVAFAVLGSFTYKLFAPWGLFIILVLIATAAAVLLFFDLFRRHMNCKFGKRKYSC